MTEEPVQFRPYSPEIARLLATKAVQLYRANPEFRSNNPNPCGLCNHQNREEIDYLLLIDATATSLRAASGRDPDPKGPDRGRWAKARYRLHRDRHLMPMVRDDVGLALAKIEDLPFPKEGNLKERGYWYLSRAFLIHENARKNGRDMAALLALREMRTIDIEMLSRPGPGPDLEAPGGDTSPVTFSERDDKLMAAFAKSRPKQPIEDAVEGGDGGRGDAGTAGGNEAPR